MARGNFGERLKRERELREVTIEELTKSTRISARFLQALENEDWDRLPGGVFGHGFVRSIARYLGLDEESLLAEYDLARAETLPKTLTPEERIPSPPKWIPVVAVFALLLLVISLFFAGRYGWRRYVAHRAATQSGIPAPSRKQSDTNAASSNSSGDPVSDATLHLSLSTSAATRVRVLADGELLLDAEVPAGETRRFSANEQFEVTAADSSAVLLEMNGKAMPPVGAPGASGKIVLTRDDLR
jgi:cytoskeleton protein RodZ